jgi:hypothetical protein
LHNKKKIRRLMGICAICLVLDVHLRHYSSRETVHVGVYDSLDENVHDFI